MHVLKPLRLLLLVLLLPLAGCSRNTEQLYHERIYVFGTLVDVSIYGAERDQANKALAAVAADFRRWHHEWHAWKPGPLVDINAAIARGDSPEVIPSLIPLIKQSKVYYDESEGLFNPAIGHLLDLWGFQSDERPSGPPPPKDVVAAMAAQSPNMDQVTLEGNRLHCTNPMVQLDFGAVAKGYADDLAIARMRQFGVRNAIVNAGGGLEAIGRHGDRPWRIGVRHPQGKGVLASLTVRDGESVHTSGNYERYEEYKGIRYAHIIDPRTGMPVQHVASVTVIGNNGAMTDAAATALVVAGPKQWYQVAKRMHIKYVMMVDEAGTVYMNPAMAKRIEFEKKPEKVVISDPL